MNRLYSRKFAIVAYGSVAHFTFCTVNVFERSATKYKGLLSVLLKIVQITSETRRLGLRSGDVFGYTLTL